MTSKMSVEQASGRPCRHSWRHLPISVVLVAGIVAAQAPQPDGAGVRAGVLPKQWITGGPNCMEVPDWQVHEYNPDFYILRESGCTHYEKPFLYLLFGKDKVLLEDTGAGKAEVARAVDDVIRKWLKRNHRDSIELVVAHSHSHGDHVAGDKQFKSIVPLTTEGTARFY